MGELYSTHVGFFSATNGIYPKILDYNQVLKISWKQFENFEKNYEQILRDYTRREEPKRLPKRFDLVSADESIVGDSKYLSYLASSHLDWIDVQVYCQELVEKLEKLIEIVCVDLLGLIESNAYFPI